MNRAMKKIVIVAVILAASSGYKYFQENFQGSSQSHSTNTTSSTNKSSSHNNTSSTPTLSSKSPSVDHKQSTLDKIRKAADSQKSGWWLVTEGKVIKTLKDDTKGHQHQKFLLKLSSDITLLVAHNIDLAPRVPLHKGDTVKIRGRYEWNNRGGVLHWTHHDPKGRQKDGWIYHQSKYYK